MTKKHNGRIVSVQAMAVEVILTYNTDYTDYQVSFNVHRILIPEPLNVTLLISSIQSVAVSRRAQDITPSLRGQGPGCDSGV